MSRSDRRPNKIAWLVGPHGKRTGKTFIAWTFLAKMHDGTRMKWVLKYLGESRSFDTRAGSPSEREYQLIDHYDLFKAELDDADTKIPTGRNITEVLRGRLSDGDIATATAFGLLYQSRYRR